MRLRVGKWAFKKINKNIATMINQTPNTTMNKIKVNNKTKETPNV